MAKMKRISPRKEPRQKRSIELRKAILEAAVYVLKKEGPYAFTTNKVADRAGVNIASLYQYYPNKESLLFHLVEMEWTATFETVFPILEDQTLTHRKRLLTFIEKFYETEAEEADLRLAISGADVLLEDTREYHLLVEKADAAFLTFLSSALKGERQSDLRNKADFIHQVISNFSEGQSTKDWTNWRQDAAMMGEMVCEYFKIND